MEILIYTFLVYNLLAGIVILIYFLLNGKNIDSIKMYAWILFLPFVGLGKWHYINRFKDIADELEYPEKWYIYKYMIKVNIGFIIFTIITTIVIFLYLSISQGSSLDSDGMNNNMFDLSLGILFDLGYIFFVNIIIGTLLTWLVISFLVLIILPKYKMKEIENALLIQKLYKHNKIE